MGCLKGVPKSSAHRKAIGAANQRAWATMTRAQKLARTANGRAKASLPEGRRKLAIAMRHRWERLSQEERDMQVNAAVQAMAKFMRSLPPDELQRRVTTAVAAAKKHNTGRQHTDAHRAAIGAGSRRVWSRLTPAQRKAQMADAIKAAASPAVRERRRAAWSKMSDAERAARIAPMRSVSIANPSSIELAVQAWLDALGIAYEAQKQIGRYHADICISDINLVIECDGAYWHRDTSDADCRRDKFMTDSGWMVLRLPEAKIKSGEAAKGLYAALGLRPVEE